MRKLVAAAICLLSLSLRVTTRRRCIKEARTRTGKKSWEQQLRRVDYTLSRAEDTPEGSRICLSHRNLILAEDKRCSMFLQFLAQTFDRGVVLVSLRLADSEFLSGGFCGAFEEAKTMTEEIFYITRFLVLCLLHWEFTTHQQKSERLVFKMCHFRTGTT